VTTTMANKSARVASAGGGVGDDGWRKYDVLVRVTPSIFSGFVWLAASVLLGAWFPLVLAVLLAAVVGVRRWPPLFGWVHGVRASTESEAAAVWAALISVQDLRGRGQPRIWIDTDARAGVEALTHHDLAVPVPTMLALLRGQGDPEAFCAAACWTLGTRKVRGDGLLHGLAELFWLPSSLVGAVVGGPVRALLRFPVIRSAWAIRFVYGPIALWQQWGTPRFGFALAACAVLALTYLAPRWQRLYRDELCRAGDAEVLRCGMGLVWAEQLRLHGSSLATHERAASLEAAGRRQVNG